MLLGMILPLLIIFVGALFLVRLEGFFIFHPVKCARRLRQRMKDKEARRSLFLALATVFSAVIIYAEATLSASFSGEDRGGIHKALAHIFPRCGSFLGALYAGLTVLLAFLMGSAIQSSALASCAEAALDIPIGLSSLIFLFAVIISVAGKSEKIAKITEKVIPLTTIIYIIMALSVIFVNISRIPQTLSLIVKSAFAPASVGGGALREGDEQLCDYYFGNLDIFRMVCATDVQQPFSPTKTYLRDDPYDNQSGEAEYEDAPLHFSDTTRHKSLLGAEEC